VRLRIVRFPGDRRPLLGGYRLEPRDRAFVERHAVAIVAGRPGPADRAAPGGFGGAGFARVPFETLRTSADRRLRAVCRRGQQEHRMPVEHLDPSASHEEIAAALARDACCVVDRVVPPGVMDRLQRELAPWLERTREGTDSFSGRHTQRTGGLIGRSQTARELVEHETVIGAVRKTLEHAKNFQLHLTQVIAIGAGESAQAIHRDQWAFDFFPFPKGYEVQCNTLWAMTDFTEENGATRVISGSHRFEDRLELSADDTEPAEMEKGSVLFYTGALYHGGGANRSSATRYGLNITYALAWLRQEENQYLSVPREVCRDLPESLLRLMGYQRGAYALGYVDDLRDPIEVVRPDLGETRPSLGELADVRRSTPRPVAGPGPGTPQGGR